VPEAGEKDARRVAVGIVGPTASGKSALAVSLAKAFDGAIVSCDALQVYRCLDIGTGKIPVEERGGVPHHLLDVVDPDEEFTAADYIRTSAPIVMGLDSQGILPIVVGGTGLYLRALMLGLFEGPGRRPELRARISAVAERHGADFVHRMLARLDPDSADRIHPNDRVRMIRALEVIFSSHTTMSEMMSRRRSPLEGYRFLLYGLAPPREQLISKIERRVNKMFRDGFVDEVRYLLENYGSEVPAFKAIGYKELARYFSGELSLSEAEQQTVRATVQYAKRQMTWFRREDGVQWLAGWGEDTEVETEVRERIRAGLDICRQVVEGKGYAKTAP
jgi:tRNA dimethylallyltransferase